MNVFYFLLLMFLCFVMLFSLDVVFLFSLFTHHQQTQQTCSASSEYHHSNMQKLHSNNIQISKRLKWNKPCAIGISNPGFMCHISNQDGPDPITFLEQRFSPGKRKRNLSSSVVLPNKIDSKSSSNIPMQWDLVITEVMDSILADISIENTKSGDTSLPNMLPIR